MVSLSGAAGPVATLVQRSAAGVEINGGLVTHYGEAELMHRPVLPQHAALAARGGEADGRGLFYYPLAVHNRVERAVHGPALYRESGSGWYPAFERQGLHALKQLVEAPRREAAELEQYTLGKA